jgi:RNA recognition motif-containing protein
MSKNIYVGNLPWSATEQDVENLFATYGQVANVKLISDRDRQSPWIWFRGNGKRR